MSLVTTNPPTTETDAAPAVPARSRMAAYVELTKLRISVMVILTFACTAVLAALTSGVSVALPVFGCGLAGMLLIACSGNAMNMYLERDSDYRMPRTAGRPLPAQELTASEVVMFAAISLGIGLAFLFGGVNWQTGLCGVVNWVLYVFVYTPLKRVTPWNTEVGAVAGALPVIMGALATTQSVGLLGWSFFGVLFFWQFPHFFAIAWKYRDQYRAGGLKMLTVTEPTGRVAGIKSVIAGVALLLVSLVPAMLLEGPVRITVFLVIAAVLGAVYLRAAIRFCRHREDAVARRLLHASLIYLPMYMIILVAVFLI